MSLAESLTTAIAALEDQRADIDRAIAMLRSLVAGEGQMVLPKPPPPARPAPIVTAAAAPPKPAARAAAKGSPGRPPGELRARLVELVDGLGRWSSTSDIAAALEAPAKRVSTILVQLHGAGKLARRPGPPAPGDQPRFEYGALALIGGRAAAGMRATDNGRVQP